MTRWQLIGSVSAMLVVLESILPFLSPQAWRRMMAAAIKLSDKQARGLGFFGMIIGVGVLVLIHRWS